MRHRVRPSLGVCAADPQLRRVVNAAAAAAGASPCDVPDLLAAAAADPPLAALFCVRDPRHGLSAQALTAFRERCPAAPVLIYVSDPDRDEFEPFVTAALRVPGITFEVRRKVPDESGRIVEGVRGLLREAPVWRALSVMDAAVERMPALIREFLLSGLLAEARARGVRSVSEISAELGVSARTLERRARDASLPGPRELLDWAALLFWLGSLTGDSSGDAGIAHGRAHRGRRATIRRLRRRLRTVDRAELDFDFVCRAFTTRTAGMRVGLDPAAARG